MVVELIIYIAFAIITQFLTYKWIRRIDKKEREKLRNWETSYVNELQLIIEAIKDEKKKKQTKSEDLKESELKSEEKAEELEQKNAVEESVNQL